MSVHAYHPGLKRYDPEQVWHDGCPECEFRGATLAIHTLDTDRFRHAWERAARRQRYGLVNVSKAEAHLLDVFMAIQNAMDRAGIN